MTIDLFADPIPALVKQLLAWHVAVDVASTGPAATAEGGTIRTLIRLQDFLVHNARTEKRS